jgi:hypothetical protein
MIWGVLPIAADASDRGRFLTDLSRLGKWRKEFAGGKGPQGRARGRERVHYQNEQNSIPHNSVILSKNHFSAGIFAVEFQVKEGLNWRQCKGAR